MDTALESPANRPPQQLSTWLTYVGVGERELPLLQPIPIVAEEVDDEWLVRWLETDISALGDSLPAALESFQLEVMDLYDDLSKSEASELGPLPRRWLKILRVHVQQ